MNSWIRYSWCGFAAGVLSFQTAVAIAAPAAMTREQPPPIILPLEGKETPASLKSPPSEEEIWQDYPKLANLMHLPGLVKLTCDVGTDATIDHCVVDSEAPTGLGFAAGALHIASGFQMKPATIDGAPVKAKFTTLVRFLLPATATAVVAPKIEPPIPAAKLALASQMISLENFRTRATQSYEASLEQVNQELEYSGRPSESPAAMDAYRQGVQDALGVTLERKAQTAAMQMSEAELSAAVTFLESSAGQAWLTLNESANPDEARDLQTRVGEAARKRYCAQVRCELSVGAPPAKSTSP